MKNKFKEYYKPDFKQLWNECIFIFDTNVLLNLYRMNDESKDAFLDVMRQVKDRIWIPYQVGLEYHRNRVEVINEIKNNAEKLKNDINKDINGLKEKLNKLFKQTKNAKQDKENTAKILEDAEKIIDKSLNNSYKKAEDKTEKLLQDDKIQQKLNTLFKNKTGDEYDKKKLEELYKTAEERYKEKIPPGFKDTDKQDYRKYSDYIIWYQILEYAKNKKSCVIFITGDEKEDWWLIKSGKKSCHPTLKKEFYKTVGQEFHMYTPEQFIDYANQYLGTNYSKTVIDEVKSVRSPYYIRPFYERNHRSISQRALTRLYEDIINNKDNLTAQIITLAELCRTTVKQEFIDYIFHLRNNVNEQNKEAYFLMFRDFVHSMINLNKNVNYQPGFIFNSPENSEEKENNEEDID